MSDFFIKTAASGTTGWRKMSNLFVKTAASGSTGWKAAIGIWIRNATQWLKVWPQSGVFATRVAWIGPNSDTAYADRLTSSSRIRIGSNYYGNNAQWDANGWTIASYSYAWKYYLTNDGSSTGVIFPGESGTGSGWTSGGTGQDVLPLATWDNATNNNTYDRKYLRFEVTANATNSTYSGLSTSPYIQIIRRVPTFTGSAALSTSSPVVGTSISYTSPSWDTSEARKAESERTTIIWYRASSNTSYSGGVQVGTGSSYSPTSSDIGGYIWAVETRYNSGTDYDLGASVGVSASAVTSSTVVDVNFQATGQQRRINLPSNFTSGTTIYVSTNGYINWGGNDPGGVIALPDSGISLSPLNADLRQGQSIGNGTNISTGGLWTYSDASNFYVRWEGNQYQDASQNAEYQVKFYWNQSYADVYFINNNLATPPSTTAVKNGSTIFRTWTQSTSQSSTLLSIESMTRNSTKDGLDDDRTAIVASAPTPPTGGSAFLANSGGTSITSITSGGVIYLTKVDATGSPTPTVSHVWQRNDGGTGGNEFRTVQTGGSTYTTSSADNNYSIRAVVTWTNGVSPNQVVTTGSVSVSPAQYTVTWNANGGSGGGTTTQNAGVAHTAPSPGTRTKYTVSFNSNSATSGSPSSSSVISYYPFSGYYDSTNLFSSIYGPIASGGSFTPPSSITMYAVWGSTTQAVTLATQNTLSRTGYTFGGWNTNTSGTGTTYTAGSSYTPSSDITLYAKWNPITYTISYDKNTTDSVSAMPSSQTKTYGVDLTLSGNTPGRTGYTFAGWATSSTGNVVYAAGGTYTANASATLYAKWTANSYTISYFGNGNTGGTAPSSQTYTYGGSAVTISGQGTLTRTGYTFVRWNTQSNGNGTNYSPGTSYSTAANLNLYAVWQLAFTAPTCVAPSLQFQRNTNLQYLRWYCDYPTPSGDLSYIDGMQWQLSTTASTTGLLNSGIRAYPGAGSYPYNVGGVGWAFKAGVDGQVSDITYSSSARYGRARVVMVGTDGNTYYGTWSSWI